MTKRSIKKIISSKKINMGGNLLDQPLPTWGIDQIDPFLLIHHWDEPVPKGKKQEELGVGPHPHRGFSPVTFIFKGSLSHQDSIGNHKEVGPGGTQWMHAGKGIIHSERPGKELAKNGGESEFIQFWVNTPAKYKMEKPYYLALEESKTPKIEVENGVIYVVAGSQHGVNGAAKTYSPQTLLRANFKKGAHYNFEIDQNFNAILYVLNGKLHVNEHAINGKQMLWFENDGQEINVKATEDSRFIILSGEPLNEKVVSHGPFVMNNEQEIYQAIEDYQNNKMGTLKEIF